MWRRLSWLVLAVAVSAAVGCDGGLSPQARQQLQAGYEAYGSGDDKAAIARMDEFLSENPRSKAADQAFYIRGLAKYRMKNYAGAKIDLAAAQSATGGKVQAQAAKALGDLAYQTDDMPLAESMYRQALADLDKASPSVAEARYYLGQALQRLGRWQEADVQFERVIYSFGDTDFAKRSARLIHCTAWTVQAGEFRDKSLADAAAADLRGKGLPAMTQAVIVDGKPMFSVQVGRYGDYAQAAAELPAIRKFKGDAFIAPTR